jgi:hypothetical protein
MLLASFYEQMIMGTSVIYATFEQNVNFGMLTGWTKASSDVT